MPGSNFHDEVDVFVVVCDLVIYKKYVFGLSDDQNMFLIYIWSSSAVLVSQPPTSLEFSKY